MRTLQGILRSIAGGTVLAIVLLGWPAHAKADAFGDLVWIVQQMEAANVSPFPVKSAEIQSAQKLFQCIAKDSSAKGVTECLYSFSQTAEGKKLLGAGATIELPPWLENVIQAYIHINEGDFWGVVGDLGEAAICIIAQIMAAGIDLCGLIEDLIAVGEAMLDAGKAVAQFAAAVGGAAWEGIKSAGCALGLGGCGGSGPPKSVVAYQCVFAPRVKPEGLKAIEAVDPFAFPKLRDALVSLAAKPDTPCAGSMLPLNANASDAAKAAEVFTGAVQGAWTGDILDKVLAQRDEKRMAYPTAQQVAALADAAAAEHGAKKTSPKAFVVERCTDDFATKLGFAHVDRWLLASQTGGLKEQPKAVEAAKKITSNRYWCEADFFGKHSGKIAERFHEYAKVHYCPAGFGSAGGKLLACATLEKHAACAGLMGSVGQAGACGVNAPALGKEVAGKIAAHFQAKGSKFPCQGIAPDGGAPLSNKPFAFACSRPTQQHYCKEQYHALWKGPPEILDCTMPASMVDPKYAALAGKVKAAVQSLQGKHPSLAVDKIDPLLVHAGNSATFATLKQADEARQRQPAPTDVVDFAFSLTVSRPIDGLTRPTIAMDIQQQPLQVQAPMSVGQAVAPVKPGDPDPWAKPSASAIAGAGIAGPAVAGAGIAAAGAPPGAAGAPAKTLSGPLPSVIGGSPGSEARKPGAPAVANPAPPPPPAPSIGFKAPPSGLAPSSALPAVQSGLAPGVQASAPPPRAQGAASGGAPNWSAVGQGGLPQPPSPARAAGLQAPSPAMTAAALPGLAALQRELTAVSCTATAGGLRFTCTTRAGFDRCESMRRRNRVESCNLNEHR